MNSAFPRRGTRGDDGLPSDSLRFRARPFSWRRHRVAIAPDGRIVGVLAAYDGRLTSLDDPHLAWMLLCVFGLCHTLAALLRGLVLEGELPAPKGAQTYITHCAIDERWRGTGVFTAMFEDACRAGVLAHSEGREVVLDVLLSNPRAAALYRRLGFVEQLPRAKPVSHKLPIELESIRMRLGR